MAKKQYPHQNNSEYRTEIKKVEWLSHLEDDLPVIGVYPLEKSDDEFFDDEDFYAGLVEVDPNKCFVDSDGIIKNSSGDSIFDNVKRAAEVFKLNKLDFRYLFLAPQSHKLTVAFTDNEFDLFKAYVTPARLCLEQPSPKK